MRYTAMFCVLLFGGCGKMLGVEEDYILRAPITVQFDPGGEPVTIPAGTHVKRTFFKEDVAFIQLYGTTSRGQLSRSGDEQ